MALEAYTFDNATRAAWMAGCTNPRWTTKTAANQAAGKLPPASAEVRGAPQLTTSGVATEEALKTLIKVRLRTLAHQRRAQIQADTFDATATYTVTINATAVNVATPADADALWTTMATNVNASAVASLVTATAIDSDGENVSVSGNPAVALVIVGDTEDDWSFDISATATGVLSAVADPTHATAVLWTQDGGFVKTTGAAPATTWEKAAGGEFALDYGGLSERFDTGGLGRVYMALYDIRGAGDGTSATHIIKYGASVRYGPSILGT